MAKMIVRNGLPLKLACHVPTNCLALEVVAGWKSWAKTIAHDTSNSTVPNAVERIIGLHAENLDTVILRRGLDASGCKNIPSLNTTQEPIDSPLRKINVETSPYQCAGINRHEAGEEESLRERSSDPLGPEFCVGHREVHSEA